MFKKLSLLIFFLTGLTLYGISQNITNYTFAASGGTFAALTTPTNPTLSGTVDEGFFNNIPIGFDFWYMGTRYTTVSASTNGWLTPGGNITNATPGNVLATAGAPRPVIGPLWDNLNVQLATNVSYKTTGNSPTRVFAIQYLNAKWGSTAVGNTISFKVNLYESTGKVEFIYRPKAGALLTPSASIGITAIATGSGNYRSLNGAGVSPTVSSIAETTTISAKPASGQTYAFTPPVPTAPGSLTFSSIGAISMTLNWADLSSNETGFVIYRSTDGVTYSFVSQTAAGVTSSMQSGLTAGTTYYWKIYAVSEGGLSSALSGQVTVKIFTGTGTFSTAARWTGGTLPIAGESLIIDGTCTVDNSVTTDNVAYGTLSIGTATGRTLDWALSGTNRLNVLNVSAGAGASTLNMTNGGTLSIRGTLTSANLTFTLGTISTVDYSGTNQTVVQSILYANLTLSNSGVKIFGSSAGGIIRIAGALTISGTATVDLLTNTTNVNYNRSGAQTILGLTYYDLTASVSGTKTLAGNATVTNSLDIMGSVTTLDLGSFTANRLTPGGTLTLSSNARLHIGGTNTLPSNYTTHSISAASTIEYSGTTQSVATLNSVQDYGNVIISGSGTKTLAGTENVSGNLTISAGTFDLGANTINRLAVGGTLTVSNGAVLKIGGTNTFPSNYTAHSIGATSTIEYGGTTQSVIVLNSAQSYGNLTISGSAIKTLAGIENVVGNLAISAGTFDLGANTINRLVAGGTLTVSNGARLKIGGTNTFPSNYTAHSIGATSTIEYGGTTQSVIVLNSAQSYGNLTISGSAIKTLAGTETVAGDLTISAGTFDLGSFTADRASAGGTLTVSSGATLKIGGTSTIPSNYTAHSIGATSTIEYGGTNQSLLVLNSAQDYGNLTISGSGTKTLAGDENVGGTLTFTNGTVTTGANTLYLNSTGTVSRTSGHVIGNFKKNVALGPTTKTFEVGDVSNYTPVTIAFASVTTAGDLTVRVAGVDHANIVTSNINVSRSVNRNWSLTNSGIIFTTYGATFTFAPGTPVDLDAGSNTSAFIVGKYSAGSWTYPTVGTKTGTSTQATGLTAFGDFQLGEFAAPNTISGKVFEDMNYGGGAGRSFVSSSGVARPGARVEVFSSGGTYQTFTTTDGSGNYTFSLQAGTYIVRVVNSYVTTSRGILTTTTPNQTFRTDASSGAAVAVTDHVGGEAPGLIDAFDGSTTLAALTTGSNTPQSITTVALSSGNISGVDFGYCFNVIVNANNQGQGSLRRVLIYTNAMPNTGLAQSGLTAGIDHAIFMLADGTARPGLTASYPSQFVSGVATISLLTAYPTIIDPLILDVSLQPGYANVPMIELNGAAVAGAGFTITAGSSRVRGFIINRFTGATTGIGISISTGGSNTITGNYIGTNAAGTTASPNQRDGILISSSSNNTIGGTTAGERNLISGNAGKGVVIAAGTGNAILSNSIYGNTGIGIDLADDGVTVNNGTKSGALANSGMDAPVFTTMNLAGTTLTISGYVGSAASQATFASASVEVFKADNDASGFGEGQTFLGALTTDASGNFSGALTVSLVFGDKITGTARDASNNTSEFGLSATVNVIKTFTGVGNFSTAARWTGGILPVAGENFIINGACTVDNNGGTDNVAYGTLTIGTATGRTLNWAPGGTNRLNVSNVGAGAAASILDMTNGGTLIIRGIWTAANLTFTPGAGTIDVRSTITLPAACATYSSLIVNGSSNTVTASVGISVTNFTINSGTVNLNTFTLTTTGTAVYTSGTINNGTVTSSGLATTFSGTVFGAIVNATSDALYLNGSTFNNIVTLTKNGATNILGTGGNTFNSTATITNNGSGFLRLANLIADDFNGDATFIQTGSGLLQPAYATNSTFAGNISTTGTATAITFGTGAGTVTLNGTGAQFMTGSLPANFNNITVTNTATPGVSVENDQNLLGVLTLAANVVFDADGIANTAVFKLMSTGDDLTQDASVAVLPSGAKVSGDVTIQRFMTKEGANNGRIYRYISSPVQNATVADMQQEIPVSGNFTGKSLCSGCSLTNQSLFAYNEGVVTDTDGNGTANLHDGFIDFPDVTNTEIFQPGQGYALFVRGSILSSTLWDLRGPINSGNVAPVTFTTTYTSSGISANDGWNLVGNPFPSTIDWNAASGWTKTNLNGTIYIKDNGNALLQHATWNGSVGTNGGSRYIASGQGFWIKSNGPGAPVLQANENIKSAGTQTTFFREKSLENLLRITMVKGTTRDETVIHFREDATKEFDSQADALKLMNATFNLFSVQEDGTNLAINSMPSFNCNDIIRLNLNNVSTGDYRMDFSEYESFSETIVISLSDKFTSTNIDPRELASYNFSISADPASYSPDRFKISFATIPVNPDFIVSATPVCQGSDAHIQIDNSQKDADYVALLNGITVSTSVVGNGGEISIMIPQDKLKPGQNIIEVRASIMSCISGVMDQSVVLNIEEKYEVTSVEQGKNCQSGVVTLAVFGAPENGYYNWYESILAEIPIEGQHSSVFVTPVLLKSSTYYVSAANVLGCESLRKPVFAEIVQLEPAQITESGKLLLSNYPEGNQWYYNHIIVTGATESSLEPKSSGQYTVEVTTNDCTITSAEYEFIVTGIYETNPIPIVILSPNPATDKVFIEIPDSFENVREVQIMNMTGQVVGRIDLHQKNGQKTGEVQLTNYSSGVYIVRIIGSSRTVEIRLIKL